MPGESHGQRSLVGYSPWGQKELDMTKGFSTHACTESVPPCLEGLPGVSGGSQQTGRAPGRAPGEPRETRGCCFLFLILALPFFFFLSLFFISIFSSLFFPPFFSLSFSPHPRACGIPVHRPEIRSEPLRLECYVCTAGVTENPRT